MALKGSPWGKWGSIWVGFKRFGHLITEKLFGGGWSKTQDAKFNQRAAPSRYLGKGAGWVSLQQGFSFLPGWHFPFHVQSHNHLVVATAITFMEGEYWGQVYATKFCQYSCVCHSLLPPVDIGMLANPGEHFRGPSYCRQGGGVTTQQKNSFSRYRQLYMRWLCPYSCITKTWVACRLA